MVVLVNYMIRVKDQYLNELLPIKIFGNLFFVSQGRDSEIIIKIRKKNKNVAKKIYEELKFMEGEEVYIVVDKGKWSIESDHIVQPEGG